jgi:hypothetical protein
MGSWPANLLRHIQSEKITAFEKPIHVGNSNVIRIHHIATSPTRLSDRLFSRSTGIGWLRTGEAMFTIRFVPNRKNFHPGRRSFFHSPQLCNPFFSEPIA